MKYANYCELFGDLKNLSQDEDAAPGSIVLHLAVFPCDRCFGDGVVGDEMGDEEPCVDCRGTGVGIDGIEITEAYDALTEACEDAEAALIRVIEHGGTLDADDPALPKLRAALAKAQEARL